MRIRYIFISLKFMHKTEAALKVLQDKRAKQSTINQNRTKNLVDNSTQKLRKENAELKNEIKDLKAHIDFLTKLTGKYNELLDGLFDESSEEDDRIIYDLFRCYVDSESDFSSNIIDMCMEINDSSADAYNIVKKYITVLPDSKFLDELRIEKMPNFAECLLDVNKIPEMIINYRRENSLIGTTKLYCCLAVDALFFRPDISVGPNGVKGFLKDIQIDKKKFTQYSNDIDYFISFVKQNWSILVKSGFVFQINPLFYQFKPFVIHIIPSSHGKAGKAIIDKLYEIKTILHNFRVEVVAFSFDGDNAYYSMNQIFYESFINRMIKKNFLPLGRAIIIRIAPDFLHIVKRLRYRLLSSIIHMGFSIYSPILNIEIIQKVLKNIPPIVFSDIPLTKMHDSLPLTLFSLNNFLTLFDKKMYHEAAFWFPITLCITSMSHKLIGYQNREFLLETAIWFLTYYKKCYDLFKIEHEDELLRERKYQDEKDVVPYTTQLLIEFTNCIYSNISLTTKYDNVDVDRVSTGPLEHTFGRSRVKCKNVHTINKFIQSVGEINMQALNSTYNEIDQVKGRSLNFGVTFEDKNEDELLFASTPQQIAYEFLCLIDIYPENTGKKNDFDNLFSFVYFLQNFRDEKKPNRLTINHITLRTQQTKTIVQRMSFTISKETNEIIDFFRTKKSIQKIDKKFLMQFYQNLIGIIPLYPCIEEKKPSKKTIIDHLNKNYYAFIEDYRSVLEKF